MLRFLSIQRLAIIESLAVEFAPGFNVLTGETGAGKSIVVGAIDLLLGGRATSNLVRTGADAAIVQAELETIENKSLIVRREISAGGRSRAFVDDTLVTAATLRETMAPLVDLHGQHDHQQLLDADSHLALLDAFAGLEPERQVVGAAWQRLEAARQALTDVSLDVRERQARLEIARFQLADIERLAPRVGEDESLATERRRLQNVDRLARLSSDAFAQLYDDEHAAIGRLAQVWRRLDELAALDATLEPLRGTRDAVMPLLDDLAMTLRAYAASLEVSPDRLQQVEDRLAALERLKRKHGGSLDEVVARAQHLRSEVALFEHADERMEELARVEAESRRDYVSAASALSARRHAAAPELALGVEREVRGLAMERARCEFRLSQPAADERNWTAAGFDRGEFVLSANPGEELRPMARIASGGELSRVMLALKTIASTDLPGKTLVFDEVDVGISGRVAATVGRRLRALGDRFQVISITHLPQVAACASAHFHVEKQVSGGRTQARVTRLDGDARVEELATLVGGRSVTAAARDTARELIAQALDGEVRAKGESERAKAKGTPGAKVPH